MKSNRRTGAMVNVSAPKMSKPTAPAGSKPMPRVGGQTTNTGKGC